MATQVTIWDFLIKLVGHPIFGLSLLFILIGIFILAFFFLKKGYNYKSKNIQIAKSNNYNNMIHISNTELDVHFGGVEKLKDDIIEKHISKIFQQYREAIQETKNISNDMLSIFIETFALENLNEHYQAFDSIVHELKFRLVLGMLDIVFNNHLNVNAEKWEYKKNKLTKQLMNTIKSTVKKDYDSKKLGISWETFDSKFFNQNQLHIKRELENFLEELKRLSYEYNEKVESNEHNIKIIKNFYREGKGKKDENSNN